MIRTPHNLTTTKRKKTFDERHFDSATSHNKCICVELFHPCVPLLYFVTTICLTMCTFQPVYVVISFVGSFACSICVFGIRHSLKTAIWQLSLVVIITIVNPIFVTAGSTEIFSIFGHVIYLECVVYGIFMGLVLIATINWFMCASQIITTEKLLCTIGRIAPNIGLALSMIGRLIPKFVRMGNTIKTTHQINYGTSNYTKQLPILIGWSMEDSIDTANAMRARGWGASKTRTTYTRFLFKTSDACCLVALIAIVVVNIFCAIVLVGQFSFYPTMHFATDVAANYTTILWLGYLTYLLLAIIPTIIKVVQIVAWRDS